MQQENSPEAYKDPMRNRVMLRILSSRVHSRGKFSIVSRVSASIVTDSGEQGIPYELATKAMLIQRRQIFRELTILRIMTVNYRHKNIIELLYSQRRRNKNDLTYKLIFQFVPQTLNQLRLYVDRNVLDIKLYIWQLFAGLEHLRKLHIIHRDVKPENLLVDQNAGRLWISDFGSAIYSKATPLRRQGTYAVTRPYRPPELALNTRRYNCMTDVWSAGCILAELFIGRPLFTSQSVPKHLQLIYELLGTPTTDDLDAMAVGINDFVPASAPTVVVCPREQLKARFKKKGFKNERDNPANLIVAILKFNPNERLHGRKLLSDPFFAELLENGKRRKNGRSVAEAIGEQDRSLIYGTEV